MRIQQTIKKLSSKKIANLGDYTNTDLKLEYGASNIELLSEADANCIVLLRSLNELAGIYEEKGFEDEAMELLRFAVDAGSDDPSLYDKLSDHYMKKDDFAAVLSLNECADESERGEQISENLGRSIAIMEAVRNEQTSEGNP